VQACRWASFVVARLASGSNINIQWQGERQASYPLENILASSNGADSLIILSSKVVTYVKRVAFANSLAILPGCPEQNAHPQQ
jgi:hypothetical protein